MRVFFIVPHFNAFGGIKVMFQHCFILNNAGIESYVCGPTLSALPFPRYASKVCTWDNAKNMAHPDDVFIFTWDCFVQFRTVPGKKKFLAQECLRDVFPNRQAVLSEFQDIMVVSKHSSYYYLYVCKKKTKVIPQWIDSSLFCPNKNKLIPGRIGMMRHRENYNIQIAEKLSKVDLLTISGSEDQVAEQLQTCEYFLGMSGGLFNGFDYTEGFCLPGAEAMATGCFVISFDNGGCLDYCFDKVNSFVSWKNTVDDVMDLLKAAQSMPLEKREEIKNIGVKTIQYRFNKENTLQALLSAIKEP
jgi:hypothetical protein